MPQINGLEIDPYYHSAVTIYPEQVQEEFARAASDIAYFGELAAMAVKAHRMAELGRREGEATFNLEHREKLAQAGAKVTEAMVESAVRTDPRWHSLAVAEIEAEAEMLAARHRFQAVLAKKDAIQSLGALMRAELERIPGLPRGTQPR